MSGRIRTIKPELLEDAITAGISSDAFRLYIGAILVSDDYGNFRADPRRLRGEIFWGREEVSVSTVEGILDELWAAGRSAASTGLFDLFSVRGQLYGHIRNWEKHQRVDHPGKPRCAGPDDQEREEYRPNTESSREPHETLAPDPDLRPRPVPTTTVVGLSQPGPTGQVITENTTEASTRIATVPKGQQVPLLEQAELPDQRAPEQEVFDHWLAGWKRLIGGIRTPKFDEKRRTKVRARLREGFTVEDLKTAVDGLWASDWHMGENPEGKRFIDLELVCRDASHVERFVLEAPKKAKNLPPLDEETTGVRAIAKADAVAAVDRMIQKLVGDPFGGGA